MILADAKKLCVVNFIHGMSFDPEGNSRSGFCFMGENYMVSLSNIKRQSIDVIIHN